MNINTNTFPQDVIPNIISYVTDRPLYAVLGSRYNILTQDKWRNVYARLQSYPLWQWKDYEESEGDIDNLDNTQYQYLRLYRYHLNTAALAKDWDVYIVLAFSIPLQMDDHDLKKYAVACARVNGNSTLAEEIAARFHVYPTYYAMRDMQDAQVEDILMKERVMTTLHSFGWIASNVRRIVNTLYQEKRLHPEVLRDTRTLSVLLGKDMLSTYEQEHDNDAIFYTIAAEYPNLTITDLITKVSIGPSRRFINSVVDDSDVPKNEALIAYHREHFAPTMYSIEYRDPILIEVAARDANDVELRMDMRDAAQDTGTPFPERLALQRGLGI